MNAIQEEDSDGADDVSLGAPYPVQSFSELAQATGPS